MFPSVTGSQVTVFSDARLPAHLHQPTEEGDAESWPARPPCQLQPSWRGCCEDAGGEVQGLSCRGLETMARCHAAIFFGGSEAFLQLVPCDQERVGKCRFSLETYKRKGHSKHCHLFYVVFFAVSFTGTWWMNHHFFHHSHGC